MSTACGTPDTNGWESAARFVGAGAPAHSFARLAHRARDIRDEFAAAGAQGVLIERPLLAPEVSALAEIAEDGPVVLLIRSVDPLVPVDVLVKATLAAASSIPNAQVVTVPFARRHDPADDAALGDIVMRNYGVRPVEVLLGDAAWEAASAALDRGDDAALGETFDPDDPRGAAPVAATATVNAGWWCSSPGCQARASPRSPAGWWTACTRRIAH